MTLYLQLAETLGSRIEQGLYRPGDRLPSVRAMSIEHGVSLSTVQQAYRLLEDRGLAEPRPKSGYFVPVARQMPPLPAIARLAQRPVEISQWEQVLALVSTVPRPDVVQLGRGMPDISSPSLKPLTRSLARLNRHADARALAYDGIHGSPLLREEVARLLVDSGCRATASDVVITTGCHEALSVSIRAVCEPGDIVAVESPSFHGAMQSLKGLGMKALEIPTDPVNGISLEALELALEQWPIKAIQVTPNCNNPLGYIMPESRKRALLALAQRYDVAIIEDDVYGDPGLHLSAPAHHQVVRRRWPGAALRVVLQGPGAGPADRLDGTRALRRPRAAHEVHQYRRQRPATATGDRRIHRQRPLRAALAAHARQYQRGRDLMIDWVARYFPEGTRASRPQGGFLLWVELDEAFDTLRLDKALRNRGVQIAVGCIFSASGKYRNCLRMNYAALPTPAIEQAVRRVGESACELLEPCEA